MKTIAILLTCHNRKDKTLRCLSNLKIAIMVIKNVKCSIFLVDDGSTDGTPEAIKVQFPKVNIIKGDGNLFWNRGMNLAWHEAAKISPDFYLWLNDDTFLDEDSLRILLASSLTKDNQAILVGSTRSEISGEITYGGRDKNGKLLIPNGSVQECVHFNGNVVLIPRAVYQKVGKLDDVFHHAIGDFDYGLRAKKLDVTAFITSIYVGVCETHDNFPKWCRPDVSLIDRIKVLYSPWCDTNPKQFFTFESRHYGYVKAMKHFISIHIRVVFPNLWVKMNIPK
jgi:GT2 family glycosyltransferase